MVRLVDIFFKFELNSWRIPYLHERRIWIICRRPWCSIVKATREQIWIAGRRRTAACNWRDRKREFLGFNIIEWPCEDFVGDDCQVGDIWCNIGSVEVASTCSKEVVWVWLVKYFRYSVDWKYKLDMRCNQNQSRIKKKSGNRGCRLTEKNKSRDPDRDKHT